MWKVQLGNTHPLFETASTTPSGGQKSHLWTKSKVPFAPKVGFCLFVPPTMDHVQFPLPLGIPGHNLPRIRMGRLLSHKKAPWITLKIATLAPNSGLEAGLAVLTHFYTKLAPKRPNMMALHVAGPNWLPHRVPGL